MPETTSVLDDFDRASTAVQRLVDGVRPEQWESPTPCSDWNVRQLVGHLVSGNTRFAAIATGQAPPGPPAPGTQAVADLGDDPAGAFRASVDRLREAFRGPGFLEHRLLTPLGEQSGEFVVHMRINEAMVHGWDLARATGQPPKVPDDIAEATLAMWRQRLADRPRDGGPFAAEQPAPADAPASDRLAAFLGRTL